MQPAENKDYSRDVILRLSSTRNTIIVEEQKPGGIAAYREIDPLELYYVINQSYASNDYLDSGFLPEHCLHLSMSATEKYFVLWNPELRADVIYGDKEYPNFPIPRMVFGVRVLENGKVAECSMGVVADEAPTMDTPMFFYPFSNVHSNDRVCTGNNVLPRYRKISALKNFPRYLLGLPDNDDMYDREHNRLKLSHGQRSRILLHGHSGIQRKNTGRFYQQEVTSWHSLTQKKCSRLSQSPSPRRIWNGGCRTR